MSNLRILGGSAKGRSLTVPATAVPTGAKVRKSLFDILAQHYEEGSAFLDLYAGSGAVGLEAASRGFQVTLVDNSKGAVSVMDKNARALNLRVKIHLGDAKYYLNRVGPQDVVFVDPPYPLDIPQIAQDVLEHVPLNDDGVVIVQHPDKTRLPEREGFTLDRREYGSNALSLYWKEN
ncbi:RsmD family RNA methyltransferase [Deinococcus cellulosilyticus]|uniref:N-6 DNA methylase n=1 Tax=Deinococcus cellulosilyticus (strain DSM 18568 / NBRC 106333 / KACC 11606 / 5516J-15) TaxID=1223518 RepID=A0A511N5S2_DEIC1|nr:RsmD family RNA methyltransferase [Deinococcus cellulosilyticus]GEM48209.1 N-6 DNA methylase [Deinococcus cellulosilyticus NBRC 106333 = KACC 11606]